MGRRWPEHLEPWKHKHSNDENGVSNQSGNEVISNSNADKNIDLDLQNVEGIGPTTAKKLKYLS
jgi:predicted flap endonuclease-1-like 5' DNA nuclease